MQNNILRSSFGLPLSSRWMEICQMTAEPLRRAGPSIGRNRCERRWLSVWTCHRPGKIWYFLPHSWYTFSPIAPSVWPGPSASSIPSMFLYECTTFYYRLSKNTKFTLPSILFTAWSSFLFATTKPTKHKLAMTTTRTPATKNGRIFLAKDDCRNTNENDCFMSAIRDSLT